MHDTDSQDDETIWVECPHCGQTFPTHDVGDVRVCISCEERFQTFQNVIEEPEFADWECQHCGRQYGEEPDECKCQRDGQPFAWLAEAQR